MSVSELKNLAGDIHVINPATEACIAHITPSSEMDLHKAISRAANAQHGWAAASAQERQKLLLDLAEVVRVNADALAMTLVAEQGRPLQGALREVEATAKRIEGLCAVRFGPSVIARDDAACVELGYKPLGVVGAISPWNFPLILSAQLMVQALLAGNGAILKPSEYTPLTPAMFADLCGQVLPDGLVGVVQGDGALGRAMCEHPGLSMIGFIGSTETGRKVMAAASGTLKRLSLELGGNDAAIVLEDADLDVAIPGLFRAAFTNAGQICMGVKRVYAAASVYDQLVEGLAEHCRAAVLGNGMDPATTLGPLQNAVQYRKVLALIEDAEREGGTFVYGGKAVQRTGYFIEPTIVTGLPEEAALVQTEQFGPVLPIQRFENVEDAITRANATPYGLGASVWCSDMARGRAIAERLEAGTVWINQHAVAREDAPFGGCKQSGLGRAFGAMGITGYTEPSVLNMAKVS